MFGLEDELRDEIDLLKSQLELWKNIADGLYDGCVDMGEYIGMGHGFSETQRAEEAMKLYKIAKR